MVSDWYGDSNGRSANPMPDSVGTDLGTVKVSALVPIVSAPASRPFRMLGRTLVIVGSICMFASLIGGVVWVAKVGSVTDFAQRDIEDALEDSSNDVYIDVDRQASNVGVLLRLGGLGVAAMCMMLGLVIVVIGGVARQLDRVLAPGGVGESSSLAAAVPAGY